MSILADECYDHHFIKTLRENGFDVESIAEIEPGLQDLRVARRAVENKRILITEDRDFGHYVYALGEKQLGVILLRYPFPARKQISKQLLDFLKNDLTNLSGKFIVIYTGGQRIKPLP